jgi:hypothetical protein
MRPHHQTTAPLARVALASSLAGCAINGEGFGRVVRQRGYEQHGPHLLPLAIFAGGSRVALYSARDAAGTWRHVYTRAPGPATAPRI